MGEQWFVFNAKEMQFVSLKCSCGTELTIDARTDTAVPEFCPGCHKDISTSRGWLYGYRKWYQAIVDSKEGFSFRVKA